MTCPLPDITATKCPADCDTDKYTKCKCTCDSGPQHPTPAPGVNAFPTGKKVFWGYLYGEKQNNPNGKTLSVEDITKNNLNYICISFAQIIGGKIIVDETNPNTDLGISDDFCKTVLQPLHEQGMTFALSIGGEHSLPWDAQNFKTPQTLVDSFIEIRKTYTFLDGIDFDIENPGQIANISGENKEDFANNLSSAAKAFKNAGFNVTIAPTSAQIVPAYGFGWNNTGNLYALNFQYFDGVMIQYYQGGTRIAEPTSCGVGGAGLSPCTPLGMLNFIRSMAGTDYQRTPQDDSDYDKPPSVGICGQGSQTIEKWPIGQTKCNMLPSEKLTIGLENYTKNLSQFYDITFLRKFIDLANEHKVPFQGFGVWSINDFFMTSSDSDPTLFKDLHAKLTS